MVVKDEEIECEFERLDGYLFVPPNESKEQLENELEAAHRAGLTGIEIVDRAPIKDFDTGKCLRFPRQAQFHPLKYLAGLAKAIRRDGGRIFTGTHAGKIEGGDVARIETEGELVGLIEKALKRIPAEYLWVAPTTGLEYLPHDIAVQKLKVLVAAAHATGGVKA